MCRIVKERNGKKKKISVRHELATISSREGDGRTVRLKGGRSAPLAGLNPHPARALFFPIPVRAKWWNSNFFFSINDRVGRKEKEEKFPMQACGIASSRHRPIVLFSTPRRATSLCPPFFFLSSSSATSRREPHTDFLFLKASSMVINDYSLNVRSWVPLLPKSSTTIHLHCCEGDESTR